MRPLLAFLLVGLVGAVTPSAQTTLRTSAVAGGAADATGGTWRVRATVGQGVAGRVAQAPYVAAQGFWPAARSARSPITLALFPETSPVQVIAGQKLRYRMDVTVGATGPSEFQYWAQNTYPGGDTRTVLGPITMLLTPPASQSVWLTQIVDPGTPAGVQTYTMRAGTHPSGTLATAAFGYTVLPAGPVGALAETVGEPGRTRPPATGAARLAEGGADDDARVGAPWLALDDTGALLVPGAVMDFRADTAVAAKDGPDTMAPEESQATATDLPAVVTLGVPYPNPARDRTTVRFGLPADGPVRLTIYDALGRRVADLADGPHAAGWHTAMLATDGLPSGIYVLRLDAADRRLTQRLTVAR